MGALYEMLARRAAYGQDDGTRRPAMKEVTCLRGWQCGGSEDEIVDQVIAHGREAHGVESTRDEILAIAVEVSGSAGDADGRPA
jgi:predicted small metal-binding protein